MSELDKGAVRQSLIECAQELNGVQSSESFSYTEMVAVEQRHGRSDGKLVDLYDRDGSPVMEETDGRKSFLGNLGGVCMNCPVLKAGDGCAIRDNFQELTAAKRAEIDTTSSPLAAVSKNDSGRTKRKSKTVQEPAEVKISYLPEEQRITALDAAAKEQRVREIAERAEAREGAVASIYKGMRQGYGYPGAATRRPNTRNELNEDSTDHISEDK